VSAFLSPLYGRQNLQRLYPAETHQRPAAGAFNGQLAMLVY
jgi:hypothetical protein